MDPLSALVGILFGLVVFSGLVFWLGSLPGKVRAAERRAEEAVAQRDALAATLRLAVASADRRAELEGLLVDSGGDDAALAERVLLLVERRERAAAAAESGPEGEGGGLEVLGPGA